MPIDMSAAVKAPPKKTSSRTRSTAPSVPQVSQADKRFEGLMGIGQLGQLACLGTKQYADAAAIGQHYPPIARELSNIVNSGNAPAMLVQAVDFLIEIGPYTALVVAAMPLVQQILANHHVIDASKMAGSGIVPPEVLEAQTKAHMARMQAEAMREQSEAIAEAQRAQAEYEKAMAADRAKTEEHYANDQWERPTE